MRILVASLALCVLSFALGVAGDLAVSSSRAGARVVVAIPPPSAAALAQPGPAAGAS